MRQYDSAFSYLARHFVSVTWIDRTTGARESANEGIGTPFEMSAFVVSVSDRWFLATAGHILEDLRSAKTAGNRLTAFQLHDNWCANGPTGLPPLGDDYVFEHSAHLYDEDLGIDCGCVYLRPHFRRLLEANGVQPVTELAWERDLPPSCDFHVLFGIPKQFTRVNVGRGRADWITNLLWVNVRNVSPDDVPEHMRSKPSPRYFGRLDHVLTCNLTGQVLADMDGFSGGPIMGFRKTDTGQLRYWVIAVQSGWDRRTRVIAGYPLWILCNAIRQCGLGAGG